MNHQISAEDKTARLAMKKFTKTEFNPLLQLVSLAIIVFCQEVQNGRLSHVFGHG